MVTKFGAFYDSTLDRIGDGATFIGIGAFLLTAADVAYRVRRWSPAWWRSSRSLLVSYARARAEGLGIECKVGHRPAGGAHRVLGVHRCWSGPDPTRSCSRGSPPSLRLPRSSPSCSASCTSTGTRPTGARPTAVPQARNRREATRRAGYYRERILSVAEPNARPVAPAKGKLGVLCVGLGAVASTFIAGVENIRRGAARPIGSLTQMGTIRLGKRTESAGAADPGLRPAGRAGDLVFGAWDPIPDDCYTAASEPACWSGTTMSSRSRIFSRHQADAGGVRPELRQAAGRQQRQAGQDQAGAGRAAAAATSASSRARTGATGWSSSGAPRPRSSSARARPTGRWRPSRRRWTRTTPRSRRRCSTPGPR